MDTDELHFKAFNKLLKEFSRSLSLESFQRNIIGQSNRNIMNSLFPGKNEAMHKKLADKKEDYFRKSLTTDITAKSGLRELLDWAEKNHIECCVVTNAPRANAEAILASLDLTQRLSTLIICEELERSKPDPLPYQTGLNKLGALPERSLAFEDSVPGIKSASLSGIPTFALRGALNDVALLEAGAMDIIDNFNDKKLWDRLDRLL